MLCSALLVHSLERVMVHQVPDGEGPARYVGIRSSVVTSGYLVLRDTARQRRVFSGFRRACCSSRAAGLLVGSFGQLGFARSVGRQACRREDEEGWMRRIYHAAAADVALHACVHTYFTYPQPASRPVSQCLPLLPLLQYYLLCFFGERKKEMNDGRLNVDISAMLDPPHPL